MMAHEKSNPCKVLLVEDNDDHAALVQRQFSKAAVTEFLLLRVASLQEALEHLQSESVDALLLDLSLPDSAIDKTLERMLSDFPSLPIVVLTSLSDESIASDAVQQGAQDYLVKSELTGELLLRAVRYAIERKQHSLALERSNAEFRRFASTVAHELRTPISAVHSCLAILKRRYEDTFDDSTMNVVSMTEERVSGMLQLIGDLLRFAHVEPESNFRKVNLAEVWDSTLANLENEIRGSSAEVTRGELPSVIGDPALLRQVFQNVISNSLKYCERQPKIDLKSRDEGDCWHLTIQDNGIGIAEDKLESIFQIFRRLEGLKKISGTGIGLSLAKRIVEHHHGSIWATSTLGEGTTFHIELPKDPSASPVLESPCGT